MTENVETEPIEKRVSEGSGSISVRLAEIGSPWLETSAGMIRQLRKAELQFPRSITTYDNMALDDSVGAVLNLTNVFLTNAFSEARVVAGDPNSQRSVDFANFINWNLQNLRGQQWWSVIQNAITYNRYGVSILQKSYARNDSTEFPQYLYKLNKLSPINLRSIEEWRFTAHNRDFAYFYQRPAPSNISLDNNIEAITTTNANRTRFNREKVMMFSWDSTQNNPLGLSPLASVWKIYKEKQWIAEYELTGVAKDLSGIAVIRIPTEILNKAAADPQGDEAQAVNKVQQDAANLHNGKQTHIVLPSDTIDGSGSGKNEWDFTLQGVEGGTKTYRTTELIDQRNKAIFDAFMAGHLYLGKDGGGSFSLAESKNDLFAHSMRKHINFIASVFRQQLFPQFAELNGIALSESEMPRLVPVELDDEDVGVLSSAMQRLGATNQIPRTKDFLIPVYERMGFTEDSLQSLRDMSEEEFKQSLIPDEPMQSRSGDGQKSGMPNGVGGSSGGSGDASVGNSSQDTT